MNIRHIYSPDDTNVPFSGTVYIQDTVYPGAAGCPLSRVEVCLFTKRSLGKSEQAMDLLVCGETNSVGYYELPVIIGSRVDSVEPSYHGHEFQPSSNPNYDIANGVVIEAGGYYGNNDFMDVEKAGLVVDVVGGLCDIPLGTSSITTTIVGCNWDGGEPYTQDGNTNNIYNNVPAHLLDVKVTDIRDAEGERIDHIYDFFQGDEPLVRTIDLRSTAGVDSALEEEETDLASNSGTSRGFNDEDQRAQDEVDNLARIEEEEKKELETVRFQYDGDLKIDVTIFDDNGDNIAIESCSNYDALCIEHEADSVHVLEYMEKFDVRVDLKYEIQDGTYCTIVDEDKGLKLRIENEVGVDNNEGFDAFLAAIKDDETRVLLNKCSDGCLYPITNNNQDQEDEDQADEDQADDETLSNAHVEDSFATGKK